MGATEVAAVREWVGDTPDDTDIQAALDRWADHATPVERVALELLRVRAANLQAAPAKWATAGDYSEDWGANLKALQGKVARLEAIAGEDLDLAVPGITTGRLVRPERDRRRCLPRRR